MWGWHAGPHTSEGFGGVGSARASRSAMIRGMHFSKKTVHEAVTTRLTQGTLARLLWEALSQSAISENGTHESEAFREFQPSGFPAGELHVTFSAPNCRNQHPHSRVLIGTLRLGYPQDGRQDLRPDSLARLGLVGIFPPVPRRTAKLRTRPWRLTLCKPIPCTGATSRQGSTP